MQRLTRLTGGLSSPAILVVLIWCVALLSVAVGPIDYARQPSAVVLTVVGAGVALFLLGYQGGKLLFLRYFARQAAQLPPLSGQTLNRVVTAASFLGIVGIALVAVDRTILSGVSNSTYSTLLRCAPGLVDMIEIKRTPLLYAGYAMFSFSFVSVVLLLLKGEEVTGWAAALAQLSIVSPVGYALLYSGRMPILLIAVLVAATMLVRLGEGRSLLPRGHHLIIKAIVAVGLFAVYSSAMWASRQNFCVQVAPLVKELHRAKMQREAVLLAAARKRAQTARTGQAGRWSMTGEKIAATDLSRLLGELSAAPPPEQKLSTTDAVLAMMREAWNVKPRGYVTSAMENGHLTARGALIGLSTYFYLTHGVRTIDTVWQASDELPPKWGLYEIGVLSPLLRVFFPEVQQVEAMEVEQKAAGIYGFFPTVWGAAFIDFGLVGAIVYVLIWGAVAGWSAAGSRRSDLMTQPLLLIFVLATVLLSPVQGPLGIANSALVLVSVLATGLMLDLTRLRESSRGAAALQLNSSAT